MKRSASKNQECEWNSNTEMETETETVRTVFEQDCP